MNILLAFAQPERSVTLGLGREHDAIVEAIKRGRCRDGIFVQPVQAMTVDALRRALLERRYHLVHIGGHGTDDGKVLAETAEGGKHPIPAQALADLLGRYGESLECVTLNECFSADEAALIALAGVPVVIGMRNAIYDGDAREFSKGFFDTIAAGRDPEAAYEQGREAVKLAFGDDDEFKSWLFKSPDAKRVDELTVVVVRREGAEHHLRIRPTAAVSLLLDMAKCAVLESPVFADTLNGLPVKWTLVDLREEDYWDTLEPGERQSMWVVAQSADGRHVSRRGSDRIQDLKIQEGTTFHLYKTQDFSRPAEPESFEF